MNIGFIIPYVDQFESIGFPESYDFRCDFSVMASRFYHAAAISNAPCRSDYPSLDDPTIYFVYDYFLLSHDAWGKCLPDPPHQPNIEVLCECFDRQSRAWSVRHISSQNSVAFNPVCVNYLSTFDPSTFYESNLLDKFNSSSHVTSPLGTLHSLCQKDFLKRKVLILDEPHLTTLCDLAKTSKQHVFSYLKSLEICRLLKNRGWKIVSFCTRDKQLRFSKIKTEFSFIDFIEFKKPWVPYLQMLDLYKYGTLFFNHYQETHGFSVYENLQMGNGVVVFSENFNPLSLEQFQNACKLNLRMSNEICADLIEEFYEMYDPEWVANDSFKRFSSDTFVERLRMAFRDFGKDFPIH